MWFCTIWYKPAFSVLDYISNTLVGLETLCALSFIEIDIEKAKINFVS